MHEPSTAELAADRSFFRRLLELGSQQELEPLIASALALIVEVTGAKVAYLEITDDAGAPEFWKGHGVTAEEVSTIRQTISRGIIARAMSEGTTVVTASALADDRFASQGSVRQHAIQAVLCAPIGSPPVGVVYLQGRSAGGPGGPGGFGARHSFTDEDRVRAEMFATQLAPLADRLRTRGASRDHTRDVRGKFRCAQIVGTSAALAQVLHQATLVAPLDIDVLVTGPPGTGKSALARAIHDNSRRALAPFITVNCAAIPDTLLESELFGAEKGAHSTALRKMQGKVAAAEGGTLFLDEIGELSPGSQAKLLHLLQAREYHPLGASIASRANIRVVTATNADLKQRMATRQFREDLYFRLHVLPIAMPALADRRDDIPALIETVCAETCARHGLPTMTMSPRAVFACREAAWPGHIRELAHAVEAAVVRAHGDGTTTIQLHHVFPEQAADASGQLTYQEATRQFQRRFLQEVLERNDWNISATARQLDLTRSHIYNLVGSLGLRIRAGGDGQE